MTTPQRTRPAGTFGLLAAAGLCTLAAQARAATPAELIGPDLNPRAVQLQSVGQGVATFFDDQRRYQVLPLEQVLQIRRIGGEAAAEAPAVAPSVPAPPPAPAEEVAVEAAVDGPAEVPPDPPDDAPPAETPAPPAPAPGPVALETADGQRFVAAWKGVDAKGDNLTVASAALGDVVLNLDDLAAVTWTGRPLPVLAGAPDRVALNNGDEVRGFLEAITGEGVRIVPEGGKEAVTLPLPRVRALRLAAVDKPGLDRDAGVVLTLDDGSRLRAAAVQIAEDRLTATLTLGKTPRSLDLPLADVQRVDLAGRAALTPALSLPWRHQGGEVFTSAIPPRAEGDALRLHAPVAVTFDLPAGCRRFAADAGLALEGVPVSDQPWADLEVVVQVDGKEVARQRLYGRTPAARINVPAAGRTLTVQLDSGVNGPVLDRVRLSEPVVYVER